MSSSAGVGVGLAFLVMVAPEGGPVGGPPFLEWGEIEGNSRVSCGDLELETR